jgi:hypothetical protein
VLESRNRSVVIHAEEDTPAVKVDKCDEFLGQGARTKIVTLTDPCTGGETFFLPRGEPCQDLRSSSPKLPLYGVSKGRSSATRPSFRWETVVLVPSA